MKLEVAYLDHILLHLRNDDPDITVLKTFLNSWFAHYAGAPFLGGGKPLWLSKKATKKVTAAHVHAISHAAIQALRTGDIEALVIDHVIPAAQLVSGLRARHRRTPFVGHADLRPYLARRFTLALITKVEHEGALKPWKSKMIAGWCDDAFDLDETTRYCRYGPSGGNLAFDIQNAGQEGTVR